MWLDQLKPPATACNCADLLTGNVFFFLFPPALLRSYYGHLATFLKKDGTYWYLHKGPISSGCICIWALVVPGLVNAPIARLHYALCGGSHIGHIDWKHHHVLSAVEDITKQISVINVLHPAAELHHCNFEVCVSYMHWTSAVLSLPCRTQAWDPGLEANSSAHKPRQPRGDSCEMSFNAKSPQPGESAAKHDEDLPKVKESTRTQNIKNHIVCTVNAFCFSKANLLYITSYRSFH